MERLRRLGSRTERSCVAHRQHGGIVLADLFVWLQSLEPAYIFLVLLPFAVAAVGLLAEWFRSRRGEREPNGL